MRHGEATWTEAKASENNQSCAVSATRLARPVPRQGHMESLQGEWHGETKCLPNPLRTAGRKWNLSSEARSIRLASVGDGNINSRYLHSSKLLTPGGA